MNNKILITGGAGFIGSHLVNKLFALGKEIIVLDNLNPQIHGSDSESYTYNSIKGKCTFIKGDVTILNDWIKALDLGIETIIHLAAETGTGQSMYESTRYVATNCQGTALLADLLSSRKYGINNVVLASSRSVYGEGKYISAENELFYPDSRFEEDLAKANFECLNPITKEPLKVLPTDELSRINPLSVYGLTKYFQENMLDTICNALDINYTALRFQNVFGPGQSLSNPYTGIISIFSNRIRQNKDIFIFEDGLESRDFVYIDDVISSIELAISTTSKEHSIFNVGSGKMTSVLEVAEKLRDIINPKSNITITGQYRKGDIRHNYADLTRIKKELGFFPSVDFHDGLSSFVNWVTSQEVGADNYEKSLNELEKKGLLTTKD